MNDVWIEKIEDYLNGKMSREERSLFESDMAADPELASTFRIYQVIETEMRAAEKYRLQDASLKETLANLSASYRNADAVPATQTEMEKSGKYQPDISKPEETVPGLNIAPAPALQQEPGKVIKMKWGKRLAIAAGFIGIILLGAIWYTQTTKDEHRVAVNNRVDSPAMKQESTPNTAIPDTSAPGKTIPPESIARENKNRETTPAKKIDIKTEKRREIRMADKEREALYAGNFKPDTAPVKKAGPLQEALAYYEGGDYENAAIAFERVDLNRVARGDEGNKERTGFYAHYYKGLSYMAGNKAAKAIPELEKALAKSPDRSLNSKAKWYLALSCLKTGQVKRAETLLKQLAGSDGAYKQRSRSLINKLGNRN